MKSFATYFQPVIGHVYKNQNGSRYLCVGEGELENEAVFVRADNGWEVVARGFRKLEDGTVLWDSSTGKGFKFTLPNNHNIDADIEYMINQGYRYHICGICTSEVMIPKDKYISSEDDFFREITSIFSVHENPTVLLVKVKNENDN